MWARWLTWVNAKPWRWRTAHGLGTAAIVGAFLVPWVRPYAPVAVAVVWYVKRERRQADKAGGWARKNTLDLVPVFGVAVVAVALISYLT